MSLEIRKHGQWKLFDWLWLAPFVLIASLWPKWRRRYWGNFVTTSVFTGTIYTPAGLISNPLYRHEEYHMRQAREVGRVKWALLYVLSTRHRIWWEAEAYQVQGVDANETVDNLRSMYAVWWTRAHVLALVLWARSRQRLVGLITEEI